MATELREELKAFEQELARVVTRFLRLYERLESEARPESAAGGPRPPANPLARPVAPSHTLPGYV